MRDQIGIRKAASTGGGISGNIEEMRTRLAEMTRKVIEPKVEEQPSASDPSQSANVPQATIIPSLLVPPAFANSELIRFTSKIDCVLNWQAINTGDELVAKKNADRYDIGKPNAHFAFANVSEKDFNTLRDGQLNMPDPVVVKGNGFNKMELDPT